MPEERQATLIEFSPDGTTLIGVNHEGAIYAWDTASGKLSHSLTSLNGRPINFIQFSPDGRWLAIPYEASNEVIRSDENQFIRLIDLSNPTNNKRIYLGHDYKHKLRGLSFSFDSQKLAISNRNETMVFDIEELNMDR